jgi:hypothetical protein
MTVALLALLQAVTILTDMDRQFEYQCPGLEKFEI